MIDPITLNRLALIRQQELLEEAAANRRASIVVANNVAFGAALTAFAERLVQTLRSPQEAPAYTPTPDEPYP